jgi:Protein of unknown function (DUF2384)
MSNTLTKPSVSRVDLRALRKQAQDQMRQMEALMRQLDSVLGGASPRARPSPLDGIKEVMQATQDLRGGNGNLSAERVAKLFGTSLSELANWLGRSRQAVSKTPDADSLQAALGFFERVARVRAAMTDDGAFRKWLRTPMDALDNESPLQLMEKGDWQVMADFVDDMLTGAPA